MATAEYPKYMFHKDYEPIVVKNKNHEAYLANKYKGEWKNSHLEATGEHSHPCDDFEDERNFKDDFNEEEVDSSEFDAPEDYGSLSKPIKKGK